jgi:signal peptide peptidase SppA
MILPDKLEVILNVIGDRIGVGSVEIEETLGYSAEKMQKKKATWQSESRDISVVPVYGSLVNRTHGLDAMSGLTTYDSIRNDFRAALESNSKAILLDIDSYGGEAAGVMDLSDDIFQARGKKPIYALANEAAFSAAYAIASAADRIFLSRTGHVGSIGVIAVHKDQSVANEKAGLKYTTVFKGDRKADLSPHAPLSDEGKAILEEEVSEHYDLFTQTVARNRGLKVAEVIATQAGMFMGQKAVDRGLADEVVSPSQVTEKILAELRNHDEEEVIGMSVKETTETAEKEVKIMNLQELKEKHPDLVAAIAGEVETKMATKFASDKEAIVQEKESLRQTVLKLEKAEAIRQERDLKAEADNVWVNALRDSDIPERLHVKVQKQVSYTKFVKDGILDQASFTEAVKAEVEDWEARGATDTVMGVGFSSKDVVDSETKAEQKAAQEDDALVDELFAKTIGNRGEVK